MIRKKMEEGKEMQIKRDGGIEGVDKGDRERRRMRECRKFNEVWK